MQQLSVIDHDTTNNSGLEKQRTQIAVANWRGGASIAGLQLRNCSFAGQFSRKSSDPVHLPILFFL
jgi:hypothetical protein